MATYKLIVQTIQAVKQKLERLGHHEYHQKVGNKQHICIQLILKRLLINRIKEQCVTEVVINNIPQHRQQLIKTPYEIQLEFHPNGRK